MLLCPLPILLLDMELELLLHWSYRTTLKLMLQTTSLSIVIYYNRSSSPPWVSIPHWQPLHLPHLDRWLLSLARCPVLPMFNKERVSMHPDFLQNFPLCLAASLASFSYRPPHGPVNHLLHIALLCYIHIMRYNINLPPHITPPLIPSPLYNNSPI